MSTVEITFRGLVGLVPKRRRVDEDFSEAVLVMPNVVAGRTWMDLDDEELLPGPIPPHTPCLVLDPELLREGGNRDPDLVYEAGGKRRCLYLLDGENVRLSPRPEDPLTLLDNDYAKEAPDKNEEEDLTWLPTLSKSQLPGSGVFNRSLLDSLDRPAADEQRVVASCTLQGGKVTSCGVETGAGGEVIIYHFRPLGSPNIRVRDYGEIREASTRPVFSQAMSPGVRCQARLASREFELVFSKATGDSSSIALRAPEHGMAELPFFNLELEEILGIGSPSPLLKKVADPDFSAFYPLSVGWEKFKGKALPIPHIGAGGRGQVNCEPPKFSAWGSPEETEP